MASALPRLQWLATAFVWLGACDGVNTGKDAGTVNVDAGETFDSGTTDAGQQLDSGLEDAGPLDAGLFDAGPVDAGPVDAGKPIVNPVVPFDLPDPFVLRVGNQFHAYGTNATVLGTRQNIPHITSNDLSTWTARVDAMPVLGAWVDGTNATVWAPSVAQVGPTSFVLYYAAKRTGTAGQQCIGRAVATSPDGPFVDSFGAPLDCDTVSGPLYWTLDPSPFRDTDGGLYLLWRKDNGPPTNNFAASRRLATSGTAFAAGSTTSYILSKTAVWESPVLENPAMVAVGSPPTYYLFYSANAWETGSYAIGYATCTSPSGPCSKKTNFAGWFGSGLIRAGPGGQDFFTDTAESLWMSMHAWSTPKIGYGSGGARSLWLYRFGVDAGIPVLSAP